MSDIRSIKVLVSLRLAQRFDREVLSGFRTVATASGWDLWMADWMTVTSAQARAADGWLLRAGDDPLLADPRVRGRCVVVSGECSYDVRRIWVDDRAQGALAAEALTERGYRHVAFRIDRRFASCRLRAAGFADRARELGLRVHSFDCGELVGRWTWADERDLSRRLLGSLPRPLGVGVFDTLTAIRLAAHCREAGWCIGPEIGIISAEHDDLAAACSLPSIAGIDIGAERIGTRAGEMLRRNLRGLPLGERVVTVPPRGLVDGGSIAQSPTSQDDLAQALAIIRERGGAVSVTELARQLQMTRRKLERHFQTTIGHGPAAEIRRERLARAAELLRGSDLPLVDVATACGFNSASALGRAFKTEWHLSPMAWRMQTRGQSG